MKDDYWKGVQSGRNGGPRPADVPGQLGYNAGQSENGKDANTNQRKHFTWRTSAPSGYASDDAPVLGKKYTAVLMGTFGLIGLALGFLIGLKEGPWWNGLLYAFVGGGIGVVTGRYWYLAIILLAILFYMKH